jgi:hypothetical protein
MEWKDWIAVYGAIVASFVAIWNVYKELQSRPRLEIGAAVGELAGALAGCRSAPL